MGQTKAHKQKTTDKRKKDLAIIHMAKAQLGLDDETYRQKLHGMFGKSSASQLTIDERRQLINSFKRAGFKVQRKTQSVAKHKQRLIAKVDALLYSMELKRPYADAIAFQMYKINQFVWCNDGQLRGIITALTNKQKADPDAQSEY